MPPGPDSPASMPTRRNTNRSGAPKRMATRLDRMPVSTSSAPSRIMMLTASRAAMESRRFCVPTHSDTTIAGDANRASSRGGYACLLHRILLESIEYERARLDSLSPTELGFTRVRSLNYWPKSETSDFGWGEGGGEGARIS